MNVIFGRGGEGGGLLKRAPLKTLFVFLEQENQKKNYQHVQNRKETASLNCHSVLVGPSQEYLLFLLVERGFQLCGFQISNFPQLLSGVDFHIIIGFQKCLLYIFLFNQDRDIRFIVLHDTIIIKLGHFPVSTNFTHIGLSSFTFF